MPLPGPTIEMLLSIPACFLIQFPIEKSFVFIFNIKNSQNGKSSGPKQVDSNFRIEFGFAQDGRENKKAGNMRKAV